jgi:hypothetical protein
MVLGKREKNKKKKGLCSLWLALLALLLAAVGFNISLLHLSEWGGGKAHELGSRMGWRGTAQHGLDGWHGSEVRPSAHQLGNESRPTAVGSVEISSEVAWPLRAHEHVLPPTQGGGGDVRGTVRQGGSDGGMDGEVGENDVNGGRREEAFGVSGRASGGVGDNIEMVNARLVRRLAPILPPSLLSPPPPSFSFSSSPLLSSPLLSPP